MLDIHFVRENSGVVKEDLKKRRDERIKWIDELLDCDRKAREIKQELDELRHRKNIISLEVVKLKKSGGDITKVLKEARGLPKQIEELECEEIQLQDKVKSYLMRLPNISHKSVPYGKDGDDNKVIRTLGKKPKFNFELKSHAELAEDLDCADFERAAKVAGRGFYYLKNKLALLDLALMQFVISFLVKKDYILVEPPFMLRKGFYEGVTDFGAFETMMYKIDNEDLYLIATSEHPICAMYANEVLNCKLPLKYIGISPCFRKEIGSHGVDEKGFFRVHQFNKIEQFIFCKPEDSWKLHEELISNAEWIFKKLKLPYRVVNICTGDLGDVAAKKYDLEVWTPREQEYKEVVSCSNCTSYQSVRSNIKYLEKGERRYVHTLNSTAVATGRVLKAILENYQQKDGTVKVPAVLQKLCGFKKIG